MMEKWSFGYANWKDISPVLEVGVDHTIGESFTANTDTFKYTVTSQLVHNQVTIDDT